MITWMWSGCYLNYSPLTGPIILYHSDSGDQGASRRPVGAGRWRPQHADAAESVSSIRHCRPRNAPPSPQGIIRHRRCSFELVPVVPQSLHSTCSLWQLDIISIISYVWSTTGIGPWTDPVPVVHSRPAATQWESQPASTCNRRWHTDCTVFANHLAFQHSRNRCLRALTMLHCGCSISISISISHKFI